MQWHNTSQIQINDDIALPTFRLTEFLVRPECSREHTTGMVLSIVKGLQGSTDRIDWSGQTDFSVHGKMPTVKLKIPGKAFLKSESRISVTFKL